MQLGAWVVFCAVVAGLLTLDIAFFHRHARRERTREAAAWSTLFVGVGLLFSLFVGLVRGHEAALQYVTAFLIEESLSVDNLFVFLALFAFFGIERQYQHRVLFWGILGAIVMRGVFIFAGVALLARFHWLIYILGVFLVATGAKLALGGGGEVHPEKNAVVRWASRVLPIEKSYRGQRFAVRREGKVWLTPLILVLLAIETTDLMFAVDSVPAVLAVSRDAFVVYTSNIFAVIGLRAVYSFLAGVLGELRFLRPALAAILVLVGVKMLLSDAIDIHVAVALTAVAAILVVATALSLLLPRPGAARRWSAR